MLTWKRTSCCISLLALLAASPATQPQALRYFEDAKKLDDGDQANAAKVLELFRKAADLGHAPSMVQLGECLLDDFYGPAKPDQAEQWFRKAADLGDSNGMWRLGMLYRLRDQPDYPQAVQWLEKAAALDNAHAQFNLGDMLIHGQGVPRDIEPGMKLIEQSVSGPDAEPARMIYLGDRYLLGDVVPRHVPRAIQWFTKAADANDGRAMFILGSLHEQGEGVPPSIEKAIGWYRRGERINDASCMLAIGLMYFEGRGMRQDAARAVEYFRRAAALHSREAMFMLGEAYRRGEGVGRDLEQARHWHTESARRGYQPARQVLDGLK